MTHVRILENEIDLTNPDLFREASGKLIADLAGRLLLLPEIRSLRVNPRTSTARIGFETAQDAKRSFLERLLSCLEAGHSHQHADKSSDYEIKSETRCWVREGQNFAPITFLYPGSGLIRLEDPRLASSTASLASQILDLLATRPGIRGIQHQSQESAILIRFNPKRIDADAITDEIIATLSRQIPLLSVSDPKRIPMAVSTTTVGLGTLGQLLIPAATPVAAGILIATNYHAVRDAAGQLTKGKVGVPLFHTALLTCSIVTGQVLAFALTDWSLRYWQRRWRNRLVEETEVTLQETLPTLVQIRHVGSDGIERLASPQSIRIGDRLRILKGEMIPADGRVVEGIGLLDEATLTGTPYPARKQPEDKVFAGSVLLAGQIEILVENCGQDLKVEKIGREISRTAALIPMDPLLNARIQSLGDKTALPVLATAGIGWAAGTLITVGAILHQDWVSGPFFAVPLVTLQHLRECLAHGLVMRHPSGMMRLAESQFLLLDGDDPALMSPSVRIRSMSPAISESNAILQAVVGASLYLGDARTGLFLRMAAEMGIAVKQPNLVLMTADRIEVSEGQHRIILHYISDLSLGVEIDGKSLGEVAFEGSAVPAAAELVRSAQQIGFDVFLLSSKPERETEEMATKLGIPLHGGDLDPEGKVRFVEGLRARGVKTLLAGSNACVSALAPHVYASISLGEMESWPESSDFSTQGRYYPAVADLLHLAQRYMPEIRENNRKALIPNLLCVAGAFGGLLNGITSGVIANIAVANVDRDSSRKLSRHPASRARVSLPKI